MPLIARFGMLIHTKSRRTIFYNLFFIMNNYKTLLLLFFLLALPLYVCGGKTVTSERTSEKGRETTSLNRLWKYKQGDVAGAAQPQYNDADWEPIGLPHSFSIPYFLSKDFYVGYGWYRKHLQLEKKTCRSDFFWNSMAFFRKQKFMSMDGWLEAMQVDIQDSVSTLVRMQWRETM